MEEMIFKLKLVSSEIPLFNENDNYLIPLYQRAYAWTSIEIEQLIEDIEDYDDDTYYLGSLVVHKREDNKYEVIDGQQRLTTLFLLLTALGIVDRRSVSFECREKSNYTLEHLDDDNRLEALTEINILDGYEVIKRRLPKEDSLEQFKKKLENIVIYRIEVPEHTDLNRYFEIMNTRGEQLEQHDILKSQLMSFLGENAEEKNAFNLIWNACSDIDGYVQMHFNKVTREKLFDIYWDSLHGDFFERLKEGSNIKEYGTVKEILNNHDDFVPEDEIDDKDERVRFESIVRFPNFLLHTLKVFVKVNNIIHEEVDSKLVNELDDDKKLLESFDRVIKNGLIEGKHIDEHIFSIEFVKCLLKCRFNYDKFIIKREKPLDDKDGKWSLKKLKSNGQGGNKKPSYINTELNYKNRNKENANEQNLKIQSCLRVSYLSQKNMHWITDLLTFAYGCDKDYAIADILGISEKIAIEAVKKDFFDECKDDRYCLGVNTPHIVFNFLDYLLWSENKKKYSDFDFEFRNSVEHWFPQHPIKGENTVWENVDTFGNLCIIHRDVNSKFSNLDPKSKYESFKETINKGSIKLRLMSLETLNSSEWVNEKCFKHEQDMVKKLKDNCGILIDNI